MINVKINNDKIFILGWSNPFRGDSRIFLMGWHRGGKIQSGGAHGISHVPQHKWDDIKWALHKRLDNSSLFL